MYSWQVDCIAAVLETDESKLHRRLYEATAAIEQRLLAPLEPGSVEERALRQAQVVLAALKRHSESKSSKAGRRRGGLTKPRVRET
jgi:hypothetical protein